jgi:hypothetical protein
MARHMRRISISRLSDEQHRLAELDDLAWVLLIASMAINRSPHQRGTWFLILPGGLLSHG